MMKTKIIKVTPEDIEIINEAAQIIKNGGIVAFPTETVYGLGADAFNEEACNKIYEIKGRPSNKPLSLLVSDKDMIDSIAVITPIAQRLIDKFFPGSLTLILNRNVSSNYALSIMYYALTTVGVRMPNNEIALSLIRATGNPIAAPSANLSGQAPPTNAYDVLETFNGKIPLIIDGGVCEFGISSTIVDLTGESPIILRHGAISDDDIFNAIK